MALLIVDHDLSAMPEVEFLARARELHPLAKRVLLVERDYSARSPVIPAMTLGQADYHLAKPWVLEQDLYRLISEFRPSGPRITWLPSMRRGPRWQPGDDPGVCGSWSVSGHAGTVEQEIYVYHFLEKLRPDA